MKKYILILGLSICLVSCNTKSVENELIDVILSDLNTDSNYPIDIDPSLTDVEKLRMIDSILDVRYTKEDLSAYISTHRIKSDLYDTLIFKAGLLANDSNIKSISVYYHDLLIIDDIYKERDYEIYLKPKALGKDSIFVNIRLNEKDYSDYLYFDVIEEY